MRTIPLAFAAVLLSAVALGGCTTEEGSTPECTQDVDKDGNKHVQGGCNPFAVCVVDGQSAEPERCCKDLTGGDLCLCLYGYGKDVNCSASTNSGMGGMGGMSAAGGMGGMGGTGGAGGGGNAR